MMMHDFEVRDNARLLICMTMQANCAHQCAEGFAPSKDLRSPRPSDTCVVRLVAPALNEPYIQYRACKENNLNRYNIVSNMNSGILEMRDNAKQVGSMTMLAKIQTCKWSMRATQATKLVISMLSTQEMILTNMRSTQAIHAVYAGNEI